MTEHEAEVEVLRICRSGRRKDDSKSQDGHWCMRDMSKYHPLYEQGSCAIIDVNHSDERLPGYSKVVVQGRTWSEVLERMP